MELNMKGSSFLKKYLPLGLTALAGVFILTTGFDRNQIHSLKSVSVELLPTFSLEESRVLVAAKVMTPEESKRNFGHDLISRGVKPLHVTIQNNTSNEYSLCPSSVDLPRIDASKVAFKITKSTIPRAIGYKIASFFFWPLMIPGTIDSIRVMAHHKKIKKDMKGKSMREEVVAPYSTFNRVLFVPEEKFLETFKVTLIDLETLQAEEFMTTADGLERAGDTVSEPTS
jgi:hypothetical protein